MLLSITNISSAELQILGLPSGGKIPAGETRTFKVNSFTVGGNDGTKIDFAAEVIKQRTLGTLTFTLTSETEEMTPATLDKTDAAASIGVDPSLLSKLSSTKLQDMLAEIDSALYSYESTSGAAVIGVTSDIPNIASLQSAYLDYELAVLLQHSTLIFDMVGQQAATLTLTLGADVYELVDVSVPAPAVSAPGNIAVPRGAAGGNTLINLLSAINKTAVIYDPPIADGAGDAAFIGTEDLRAWADGYLIFLQQLDSGGALDITPSSLAVSTTFGVGAGFLDSYTNFLDGVPVKAGDLTADNVVFDPGATGLVSTDVDAAIKEVYAAVPTAPVYGQLRMENATGGGAPGTMVIYGHAFDVVGNANLTGQYNGRFKIYSVIAGALADVTSTAGVTAAPGDGAVVRTGDWIQITTEAAGMNAGLISCAVTGLAAGVAHMAVGECVKLDLTDPLPVGSWFTTPANTVGP